MMRLRTVLEWLGMGLFNLGSAGAIGTSEWAQQNHLNYAPMAWICWLPICIAGGLLIILMDRTKPRPSPPLKHSLSTRLIALAIAPLLIWLIAVVTYLVLNKYPPRLAKNYFPADTVDEN